MILSNISTNAARPHARTKAMEWRQVDVTELSDEEFVNWWVSLTDEKDKFFVVNTLRRCCINASDYGDGHAEMP